MNHKHSKLTSSQQQNRKKLIKLQPLNLKQLDGVAGARVPGPETSP